MAVINQDGTLNKIANPAKPEALSRSGPPDSERRALSVDGAVADGGEQLLQYLPTYVE